MADISLLFDVAMGGGNPSGDSEQLIRSQLEAIVNGINAKPFSIKFQADEASLQQFQKRVSEIAISLGNGAGTSSAAFEQVTRQINIAATAIHTMNGAVNASNLERISTALSGLAGANISDGAIADIVSRLESMSVVLTDARIQFEDLGKTGERVPRLIIEGVDAAGNAIRRNLRFDNKGELERDLTDITVKLAEVERASKGSGTSTKSAGEKATDAFTRAKKAVTDYYNALTQLERSGLRNVITQGADGTWSSSQAGYEERVAQLNRLTQEYHNATAARQTFTASQQAEFTEHETARAQQYRVAVEDVARAEQHRQETLRSTVTITRSYDNTIADCQKKLKDWSAAENSRHQSSRDAYDALRNEVTAAERARIQYNNGEISIEQYTAAMDRLKSTLVSTKATLQQNGDAAKTFGERLAGLAKKFASWLGVSQIIMYIYRSIRKMVSAVIELDTAMTELKKVTDETDATYDKFLRNAATRAKSLGASLTDVVNTTADFARLGLSLEDAEYVSDAALVYKNVGDGIEDIDHASESLISTMQAFGIEAKDVMSIVDKFNVTGNKFAISSGGIGDALLNSAAALDAAGNTLDESIALITAANTTIQNPEKVGTALKTISMYLRAAKTEAEEAGESTEGMADSVSELRDELLALTGGRVDIQIDENTFKSTYQILKDLSEVWDDLSDISQANITELIGGKRNANVISALLQDFEIAEDVISKTATASGSALEENAKVLESIQGKINVFKATFQEFSNNLIGSDLVKMVVDIGTGIISALNWITKLVDSLGGVKTVLLGVASVLMITKAEWIAHMLAVIKNFVVTKLTTALTALRNLIPSIIGIVRNLATTWHLYATGATTAAGATVTASAVMQAAIPVVGLLLAAITAIVGAFALCSNNTEDTADALEDAQAKAEETRRQMQALADAASEYSDELAGLTIKYLDASEALDTLNGSIDTYVSSRDALISGLKIEQSELDKLIAKYGSYEKALAQASLQELQGKEVDLRGGVTAAEDAIEVTSQVVGIKTQGLEQNQKEIDEAYAALEKAFAENQDEANDLNIGVHFGKGNILDPADGETVVEGYYITVRDATDEMVEEYGHFLANKIQEYTSYKWILGQLSDQGIGAGNAVYDGFYERYLDVKDGVEGYFEAVDALNENLAYQYLLEQTITDGLPETKEEFDSFRQKIIDAASASGEFTGTATDVADAIDNVLKSQSNFASFYNAGESYSNELSNFAETTDKLKSNYDLLATAQKEMASGEGISTSTIQALADETDRYLDYLYEENGIVHLNISAWKEYANEKILGDMAIIQSRLATLEVERDALNQELSALQSKGSLTAAEQERVKELNGLLDKNTQEIASNQQAYNMYKSIFESVTAATNAMSSELKQFVGTLSQTDALDSGFSQLSTIFNDVKDGGSFDFGSIVDDNFTETFGGLGESYDKFMRIIASSPSDINACRQAFNELATAYIYSSGALDNVTDSNKDAVVAMLEQMGVTNAVALVDAQLAINKERLKYATAEYTNLTYAEVLALYQEATAGSIAQQALAELAVQKYLEQNTTLNTEADIEQLLSLATSANATAASLARVNEAKAIMAQADSAYAQYQSEYRGGNPNDLASYRRYLELKQRANDILSTPLEYETINPADFVVDFEGVSKSANSAKDDVESLYDAAKNGIEELIDYRKSMLERDLENQKDAIEEQIDALEDFYDEQREMLEDQYDQEEYLQEQHEKRKAVTDLQGELAMLANDDSAWAQKRKLELQEELSDAEQDLSEFENEHALDEALDMLDDQEERQKELLQSQIDALDEKLNDPYALYNQALTDIKNNTADLYQAMIEYNRKYGSGNDDDVRDMWNDAYESNEDYRDKTGSTYKGIELGNYAGYDASGVGKVSDYSGTLRKGSSGDGVKALQHALNQLGYGNSGTKSLDGSFGSNTRSAVIAFQRANGLSADGVVGSQTKAKFKSLGYAMGTANATPGIHAVDELGPEYVFTSGDGTRYRMFTGGEKVLTADATDFLYEFANSGGNILTKMIADLLKMSSLGNIVKPVQAIELHSGDIVVNGSCDSKTVSEIRRAQRSNLNWMLHELNKLNK